MNEHKFDISDGHLILEKLDKSWKTKGAALRLNIEEKALKGSLDESKDQVTPENIIALSPQWLHSKPSETKTGISSTPRDSHATSSLPRKIPVDPIANGVHCLGKYQDKKERKKVIHEIGSSHRWREEERDTSLLGRRDRRKDDRRPDNISIKETADSRLADQWNDVGNRNSGPEARLDGKWSSRWGDDKEKDSYIEQKMRKEKRDFLKEKQTLVGSNRSSNRETDSHDKWKPRHRMESHSGGSLGFRPSPGSGTERRLMEGSNVGFTPGRGGSSIMGIPSVGTPSSTFPIGAPVDKNTHKCEKPNLVTDTYRYPRGKLLEIYRKQRLVPSCSDVPEGLEEVTTITQSDLNEPLAFIAPDVEEGAVLSVILRGELTNSASICNPSKDKIINEHVTGIGEVSSSQRKHGTSPVSNNGDMHDSYSKVTKARDTSRKEGESSTVGVLDKSYCLAAVSTNFNDSSGVKNLNGVLSIAKDGERRQSEDVERRQSEDVEHRQSEDVIQFKHVKVENVQAVPPVDVSAELHDPGSLFNTPLEVVPGSCSKSNRESNLQEKGTLLEDSSLFYKDPHGKIQGPFFGADILSWFHQGFFGTDLLVCLSEAPEETPFQELGNVMPNLKSTAGSNAIANAKSISNIELSDAVVSSTVADIETTFECYESAVLKEQDLPKDESKGLSVHYDRSMMPESEDDGNGGGDPIKFFSGNDYDTLISDSSHPILANGVSENSIPNHKDVKVHPFGLLWSELEDSHSKGSVPLNTASESEKAPLISKNPIPNHKDVKVHPFGLLWSDFEDTQPKSSVPLNMASESEKAPLMNHNVLRDSSTMSHEQESYCVMNGSPRVEEACSEDYRTGALSCHKALQEDIDANQFLHTKHCSWFFEEQLSYLKEQNKQFQKQNQISPHHALHLNGHVVQNADLFQSRNPVHPQQQINEQMSIWEYQALRHRQFQVEQHQKQLHHHQMRLQQRQAQELLQKQLIYKQMHGSGYGRSRVDYHKAQNVLDQVILRRNFQHGGQQNPHPSRHPNLLLEQLMQEKFGHGLQREHHDDLYGQMHPSEMPHQQASHHIMSLRKKTRMTEGRCAGVVWSVDETGQFVKPGSNRLRTHSKEVGSFNSYQQQLRSPHYEEHRSIERNRMIQEKKLEEIYEQNSMLFKRSTLAQLRGLDVQERQMGSLTSGIRSYHQEVPHQLHALNIDAFENQNNGQLENCIGTLRQLQIERELREAELNMLSNRPSTWFTNDGNDERLKPVLVDQLHQQLGLRDARSFEVSSGAPTSFNERRDSTLLFSGSTSFNHLYANRQSGLNSFFLEGPQGSNTGKSLQERSINMGMNRSSSLENGDGLFFKSHSGPSSEDHIFLGMNETAQTFYGHSSMVGKLSVETDSKIDNQVMRSGYKSRALGNSQTLELQQRMVEQRGIDGEDSLELPAGVANKQHSLGNTEGKLEYEVDSATMVCHNSAQGKDAVLWRNYSCSEPDASEASFLDTQMSSSKKSLMPESDASIGALGTANTHGARNGKRKGKKGKQIDPALLGFKVSSNRIMMGEIQGPKE
ncbi:Gyf domain-containing protein [Thalictrum thalictroides]|uniref:Gyf domain-containing protein n=1 Tax=Thalictrum thalictroides TaxID=46969 RepID=A0A7J6W3D8_THATH|nr:Gyf domain-containing protein [Thalictrum thalictroides]